MSEVLRGIRVLDFGRYIAGPYCAALLGDLGAEVIRIEPVGGGDDRYVMGPGDGRDGALHHQVNRGKRSFAMDLAARDAREVVEWLVGTADVVVANMPPVALRKLRLDYESLRLIKPNVVLTTITAYDAASPYADAVGFDGTGQAMSGALSLTGTPDQPFRSGVSYVDYATAISAALGTVGALLRRETTGLGDHVQASLLSTAVNMANPMLIEEAAGFRSRVATGNRSPISGPSDLFRTTDGWIMIQIIGQPMFRRWAEMVGRSDLLSDDRFLDDRLRGDNGQALSDITAEWVAGRSTRECLDLIRAHRLPVSPVLSPAEVLSAPEIAASSLFHMIEREDEVPLPLARPPVVLGHDGLRAVPPAPSIGQDNLELLREAGFSDARIADLELAAGTPKHRSGSRKEETVAA